MKVKWLERGLSLIGALQPGRSITPDDPAYLAGLSWCKLFRYVGMRVGTGNLKHRRHSAVVLADL
jgi:hypothetical protein